MHFQKIDSEDVDVQAKPISLDTQTQHSIELDAKSCQTELVTKRNKRSQVFKELLSYQFLSVWLFNISHFLQGDIN